MEIRLWVAVEQVLKFLMQGTGLSQKRGHMSQKGNNEELDLRQLLQTSAYIRRWNLLSSYLIPPSTYVSPTFKIRTFFEPLIKSYHTSLQAQDYNPWPTDHRFHDTNLSSSPRPSPRVTLPTEPSKPTSEPTMSPSLRTMWGKIVGGLTIPVALVFYLHVCIILMLIEPILSRDAAFGQPNDGRTMVDAGLRLQDGVTVNRRRGGERVLMDEDPVVKHFIEKPRLWSRHEEGLVMADGWDGVLRGGLV